MDDEKNFIRSRIAALRHVLRLEIDPNNQTRVGLTPLRFFGTCGGRGGGALDDKSLIPILAQHRYYDLSGFSHGFHVYVYQSVCMTVISFSLKPHDRNPLNLAGRSLWMFTCAIVIYETKSCFVYFWQMFV